MAKASINALARFLNLVFNQLLKPFLAIGAAYLILAPIEAASATSATFTTVLPWTAQGQFGNGPQNMNKQWITAYDIGVTCGGPYVVYFYNTQTPTLGQTPPVWTVFIPASGLPARLSIPGGMNWTTLSFIATTAPGASGCGSLILSDF